MARIVTVGARFVGSNDRVQGDIVPVTMSYIRWFQISEALARRGHRVDIAVADEAKDWAFCANHNGNGGPRTVPLSEVKWSDYDVVKTMFHKGFETLEAEGGADHPFIVSMVGSVVGPREMDGVLFYGATREKLYATQERIDRASRFVTVLSEPAGALWEQCFGPKDNLLLVPSGADRDVPAPSRNPYPADDRIKVLFSGNVYTNETQPEANAVLVDKLNRLGRLLEKRGARLYMTGFGELGALDADAVTYVGAIPYDETWEYFFHADVGVVVSAGPFMHNNESSKIYYYLRAGLPVVSESGFPNDHVVEESRLGFVAENGNLEAMADLIVEAARRNWDRERAVRYMLENHTWDRRVDNYEDVFDRHLRPQGG
jgi:glycosyltransferase involved in cell wall biosynthesis